MDRTTGDVSWNEELSFTLQAEPIGVALEVYSLPLGAALPAHNAKGRRRSVTTIVERKLLTTVALDLPPNAWCPYPQWREVELGAPCNRFANQNPTVATLRLGLQYSFTKVNPPVAATSSDLEQTEGAREVPPAKLLDAAVRGLSAAIDPKEEGERAAVRWLVAEYGGMMGLTAATQSVTLLRTLVGHASISAGWLLDVALVAEGLVEARALLLSSEAADVARLVEQVYQLLLACLQTFDISFPAATVERDGSLSAAVRLFVALGQLRDFTPCEEFEQRCVGEHAERLVRSVSRGVSGGSSSLNGHQFGFLCRVVRNELTELSAYAPAFAPLLPEGKSLQEVVARAYHAIIPAVARGVGRELLASERRAAMADAQALGETMGHCIPGEAATDWEALLLSAAQ